MSCYIHLKGVPFYTQCDRRHETTTNRNSVKAYQLQYSPSNVVHYQFTTTYGQPLQNSNELTNYVILFCFVERGLRQAQGRKSRYVGI